MTPLPEQDVDVIQAEAELFSRRLSRFIPEAWRVIEPGMPFVSNWHIDAIAEHLEAVHVGQIRRLIINIPPRHSKSSLVSVIWPAWDWTRTPERKWLFTSYGQDLSTEHSVHCRRLIESDWYQDRWGHVYRLTSDQNEKRRFENDRTGYRLATSVGGANTGRGADVVVVDDPLKADDADSELMRNEANSFFDDVLSTRLNDPKTGAFVIIMHRLHEDDLSGHLLDTDAGEWEHLCLPARYETGRHCTTILGRYEKREREGELLNPNRFGEEELTLLEKQLKTKAAGQLQQRPAPVEGNRIKRSWFRYYGEVPPIERFTALIQSWDTTFKGGKDSDYVVGQVWGVLGPDFYLLDQLRDQIDTNETMRAMEALGTKWPEARGVYIEDAASGPAIFSMLKHKIPGLIPVPVKENKEARVAAITDLIEAGNVVLPNQNLAPWITNYVEEWVLFPNGRNDDQVDATCQALVKLFPRAKQGARKQSHEYGAALTEDRAMHGDVIDAHAEFRQKLADFAKPPKKMLSPYGGRGRRLGR